ncbi:hypothetical protein BDA99DRAFT_516956 [Phascolomyces articulosus]|uniref:Uncharacterized protein n=1 Tax=Phascolomyces articulosus TaxID=60185 RepID=A0AAD5K5J5_9FUNG|nr:hypothetical protein BDA99DRAFT_516956 [Phascolomyces articulosus]
MKSNNSNQCLLSTMNYLLLFLRIYPNSRSNNKRVIHIHFLLMVIMVMRVEYKQIILPCFINHRTLLIRLHPQVMIRLHPQVMIHLYPHIMIHLYPQIMIPFILPLILLFL